MGLSGPYPLRVIAFNYLSFRSEFLERAKHTRTKKKRKRKRSLFFFFFLRRQFVVYNTICANWWDFSSMKGPQLRTKVVIRHLPPSLSHSDLLQRINHHFSHRFNWFSFRPAKSRFLFHFYPYTYIPLLLFHITFLISLH